MAKYTLLELVQLLASSMDSDEVNSITDSVESMQIANVIKTAFYDLITRAKLPTHYGPVTLDASGDATKPILMTLPSTVSDIEWVKYNKLLASGDPINMQLVEYLSLEDFFRMMHMLNTDETNVGSFSQTVDADSFTVLYRNDKQPDFYTTFDDGTLLFDSYDSTIDTTLQKSKTLCYGRFIISFSMSDTFTPDLNEQQFALLINEAKSLAWSELKQSPHGIAERNSKRGWTHLQKKGNATEKKSDFDQLSYFGRK